MFEKLKGALSGIVEKLAYTELSERDVERLRDHIVLELVDADVAYDVADSLVGLLKERLSGLRVKRGEDKREVVKRELGRILLDILSPENGVDVIDKLEEKRGQGKPLVILFLGPNGHGKTTTIAKIARWLMDRGASVVIAASDTFRAGAIEQIEEHARRLGLKVVKHRYGADPAAVAFDAVRYAERHRIDVVLIDTAGRLQSDVNLMEEMKKIARVVKPDLKIFVGDALTGNDALDQVLKFHEAVGIDGSILTKADADAKGGAAVSIAYATGRPIVFLGVGQGYKDLEKFEPEKFVRRILG